MDPQLSIELQKNPASTSAFQSFPPNANSLRLVLLDGTAREITQVKIGRDFVCGLLEDGKSLGFLRKTHICTMEFYTDQNQKQARITWTRQAIGELLPSSYFPTSALVQFRHDVGKPQRVPLLGAARGFLVTDYIQNPVIPIASLSYLELNCG